MQTENGFGELCWCISTKAPTQDVDFMLSISLFHDFGNVTTCVIRTHMQVLQIMPRTALDPYVECLAIVVPNQAVVVTEALKQTEAVRPLSQTPCAKLSLSNSIGSSKADSKAGGPSVAS